MLIYKSKCRNWVFTLNNPKGLIDPEEIEDLRYIIYSEECNDADDGSGTNHFQGYLQFKKVKRLTQLKKYIPGAHFEPQRAKNNDDARNYCAKIGDPTFVDGPYEWGYYEGQGARTDLLDCKAMIDSGKSLYDVAQVHFSDAVRYNRGLTWYQNMVLKRQAKRSNFDGLTVIIGATGLGKSHWANAEYPDAYWLTRPQGKGTNAFFDLYEGEKQLVMDEFYGWLPYDFLLRLCDKYQLQLPIKGSFAVCQVTSVVITSNKHVWDWYRNIEDISALTRRITKIVVFTGYKQCHIYEGDGLYEEYRQRYMTAQSPNFVQ